MSSNSQSDEAENQYLDEDAIDKPETTIADDPATEYVTESLNPEAKDPTATAPKETEVQSQGIRVEKDVFYNDETIKYMRIIDTYKKLGVGKDIELPRVGSFLQKLE
jgi:hypothetical protein